MPGIDLRKDHPLFTKAQAAKASVQKARLVGQPVATYLVGDFSWSMTGFYTDGNAAVPSTMQDLGDRVLALSATVDDDGTVPVFLFHTTAFNHVKIDVNNPAGAMDRVITEAGSLDAMGGTNYAPVMQAVRELHYQEGNGNPGLVIFQTDGDTYPAAEAEAQVRESAPEPLFWQFMGYGPEEKAFLAKLNTMGGRVIDNAGYFHAGPDPRSVPDEVLYDQLIGGEFAQEWLPKYRRQFGGFTPVRPAPAAQPQQPRRRGLFGRR
jgi:hypothetical protein